MNEFDSEAGRASMRHRASVRGCSAARRGGTDQGSNVANDPAPYSAVASGETTTRGTAPEFAALLRRLDAPSGMWVPQLSLATPCAPEISCSHFATELRTSNTSGVLGKSHRHAKPVPHGDPSLNLFRILKAESYVQARYDSFAGSGGHDEKHGI